LEAVIKKLHETYQCRIYGRKLLMMGRENARNMWSFITEYIWIIGASGWLFKKKATTFIAVNLISLQQSRSSRTAGVLLTRLPAS
jgi:hypothetical protein